MILSEYISARRIPRMLTCLIVTGEFVQWRIPKYIGLWIVDCKDVKAFYRFRPSWFLPDTLRKASRRSFSDRGTGIMCTK